MDIRYWKLHMREKIQMLHQKKTTTTCTQKRTVIINFSFCAEFTHFIFNKVDLFCKLWFIQFYWIVENIFWAHLKRSLGSIDSKICVNRIRCIIAVYLYIHWHCLYIFSFHFSGLLQNLPWKQREIGLKLHVACICMRCIFVVVVAVLFYVVRNNNREIGAK